MIGPLGIDTYLPSFSSIARNFQVDPILVQQTLSIYLGSFAVMSLFYGALSDSFGRRPVVLVSLTVFALASGGAMFAPNLPFLLACRMAQGLAAGAGTVIGRAIIKDKYSGAEAQRLMAYVTMVFGLAPALAPILGGWLQVAFGWRSVFTFLCAFSLLMVILCYLHLPESLAVSRRQPFHLITIGKTYLQVMQNRYFLALSFASGTAFIGFSLYIASAANFVGKILNLPPTAFGWLFVPLVAGLVIGAGVSARLAGRISVMRSIQIGYGVMSVATVWNILYNFWFVARLPWAVLPLPLYSLGLSMILPQVSLAAFDLFPKNQGLVSSLQSFIQLMIFASVSGFLAPLLFSSGLKIAYGVLGGLGLSVICMLCARSAIQDNQIVMAPALTAD